MKGCSLKARGARGARGARPRFSGAQTRASLSETANGAKSTRKRLLPDRGRNKRNRGGKRLRLFILNLPIYPDSWLISPPAALTRPARTSPGSLLSAPAEERRLTRVRVGGGGLCWGTRPLRFVTHAQARTLGARTPRAQRRNCHCNPALMTQSQLSCFECLS